MGGLKMPLLKKQIQRWQQCYSRSSKPVVKKDMQFLLLAAHIEPLVWAYPHHTINTLQKYL
jgi:hypothetical protein